MPSFLATSTTTGSVEESVNIPVHVHKRFERFIFRDTIAASAVPISYIESAVVEPERILGISEYGGRQFAYQWEASGSDVERLQGDLFTSTSSTIEATNQWFTDVNGKREPLWYKHKLPAGVLEATVRTMRQGETPDLTGTRVDLEANAIYTNLRNWHDPNTGAWLIHFVDYKTDSNTYTEMLSPLPVASEGTWEDIDPDTGLYYTTAVVYDKLLVGTNYEYTFNVSDTYWVRPAEDAALTMKLPSQFATDSSWKLRVTNGLRNVSGNIYQVTEWASQPFFPSSPYLQATGRAMRWVNDNVLSANTRGVTLDIASGLHVEVWCYKPDDSAAYIYTTDLSKDGLSMDGVPYRALEGVVADPDSGFIYFPAPVFPGWSYLGTFTYSAVDYDVAGLELNPVFNPNLQDSGYLIYMLPGLVAPEQSIHWLRVKDGGVVECSQGPGGSYTNRQLTDALGAYNPDTIIGPLATAHDTLENDDNALFLGGIGLRDLPNLFDIFEVDVRRFGPDVAPGAKEDIFAFNPKLLYTQTGYGQHGEEVPGSGAIVLDIPVDLLEDYGGQLDEEGVREYLERYLGASSYAYINWVYPKPDLTVTSEITGQVDVIATFVGPGTYKFLRRADPGDTWTQLDTNSPAGGANSVFQDLTAASGTRYWYAVQVEDYPVGNAVRIEVF